ncbi:prothage tail length tape measure [Pseudomonas helleri]|uniref:Prothage tail length tape measure n=2 Tax=Pseudomonas helleri TaxID=1608996 RepID=A0A6L5HZA9_9PSED|nr:prothage tail length tape measure [Pseudomonas helleri]
MDKASTGLDGLNKSGSGAGKSADEAGKAWSSASDGIGKGIQQVVKELQSLNAKQDAAAKLIESLGLSLSKASTSFLDVASSAGKLKPSNDAAAASIEKVGETAAQAEARLLAMAKRSLEASEYVNALSTGTGKAASSFDYAADKAERLSELARRMRAESDANVKTNNTLADGTRKAAVATEEQAQELEKLLGKIDPVYRKLAEIDQLERELAKNKKFLDADTFSDYQDKIAATRKAIGGIDDDLKGFGLTTKGAQRDAAQLLNALKSGDWQGAARNFQQISVSSGGTSEALKSLGGAALGLVNPFTVAAAAVGVLGLAYYQGSKEQDAFRLSIIGTGNAAGTTTGALAQMAKRISATTGTTADASTALAQLAGAGTIASSSFEEIATAAIAWEKATGKAVSETIAEFKKLSEDPVKAVAELNNQYNFLTASVYTQIRAAQEQGDKQAAAAIAEEAYARALTERAANIKQDLGTLERAWNDLSGAAKAGWDAILGIGRESAAAPDLTAIQQKINYLKSTLGTAYEDGDAKQRIASLQAEIDGYTKKAKAEQESAEAAAEAARIQREGHEAYEAFQKSIEQNFTKRQKMNKALEDEEKRISRARAAGYIISEQQEAAALKAIRENSIYKETAPKKTKAYREDAGLKMLDAARQTQAVLIQQNASINAQGIATERVGVQAQALIKWEQQLADIKGKKTLTADQKSLLASQDLITAQLKKNAALEKEAQLSKDTLQAQKDQVQLLTLTGQLQKANQLKSSLDDAAQLAEYERQGNVEAAKRLETLIKIRDINLKAAQKPGTVEGVSKAPTVTGLDASFGGAYSELDRLNDQSAKLEAWRATELEKQKAYLDLKAINEETYAERVANIDEQARQSRVKLEEAKNQTLLIGASDFFGNMQALSQSSNSKLAAIGKAAAITQATIDGYLAVQKALAAFPPPFNFAAAAAVGVATAANVANIAGIGFSGGGYTGSGGVNEPAGQVHKGEVVWSQADIRRFGGVAAVEALRKGNVSPIRGATGSGSGSGSGAQDTGAGKPGGNVNIHNYGGNQVEAQRDGDDWNIFIKRAKREIAGDLASGNGDITRALTNGYGLRRVPR